MTGQPQPTGRALTVMNEMVRAGVAPGLALAEVSRMGLPGAPGERQDLAAVETLSPAARSVYKSWRDVGHSHAKALEEVRAAGVDLDPRQAEISEVLGARAFGRVSATAADRQIAAIKARSVTAVESTEAVHDARAARVFGRPQRGN
jgi:hypothetical protein